MVIDAEKSEAYGRSPENDTLRRLVKTLMDKKQTIENEIDSIIETLNSDAFMSIGLRKPLVDDQGFPLAGIDLLQVRTYRNRFAVLETDLKDILEQIDESIQEIHEHARATQTVTSGDVRNPLPFGRVESISNGSAADEAGLLVGDKVVKFGRLSCFNPDGVKNCYDAIPSIVREVDPTGYIEAQVSRLGREGEELIMRIYPKEGRIGCLIRPI